MLRMNFLSDDIQGTVCFDAGSMPMSRATSA